MKTLKHIVWLLPAILLNSACHTVTPNLAKAKQSSFSGTPDPTGNYQSSGVWGWRTNHHLVIDSTGRETYNSLIARGYGQRLTPAVTNQDYGVDKYTNNPVESLRSVGGKMTQPVANPGNLFDMNPVAVQAWPTMNSQARTPLPAPHPP